MAEGRSLASAVEVFLGLGSNLGNRETLLLMACDEIERLVGPITGRSAFVESEPWGYHSPHTFLNAVVCCQTVLQPLQLLDATQRIERLLGKRKEHATERTPQLNGTGRPTATVFHDRPIDIDILLFGFQRIDHPRLQVPHPLMLQRPFVMNPLLQLLGEKGDQRYADFLKGSTSHARHSTKQSQG